MYLKADTPLLVHHWKRTRNVLQEFDEFVRARNIRLLVVIIPSHVQLSPELQARLFDLQNTPAARYDFEKPQRLMRAWCKENDVRCVDLLPVFQEDGDPGRLYVRNDIHWNPAGHELAAKALLPVLEQGLAAVVQVQDPSAKSGQRFEIQGTTFETQISQPRPLKVGPSTLR